MAQKLRHVPDLLEGGQNECQFVKSVQQPVLAAIQDLKIKKYKFGNFCLRQLRTLDWPILFTNQGQKAGGGVVGQAGPPGPNCLLNLGQLYNMSIRLHSDNKNINLERPPLAGQYWLHLSHTGLYRVYSTVSSTVQCQVQYSVKYSIQYSII